MVVVAQDSGNSPRTIFVPPEMNEAALAGPVGRFCFRMQKTVDADLDRAISLHVIDLKGAGNEDALGVSSTNIVLDALSQLFMAEGESPLVVIELHVVGKHAVKFLQVAAVVGIEKLPVKLGNCLVEIGLILDF